MENIKNTRNTSQTQSNILRDVSFEGNGNVLQFAPIQNTVVETQIIQISRQRVTQQKLIKASPYKGLYRFNASDRDHFYGRDRLIKKLLKTINQSGLTLVTGASGSGKSSLIRAGIIPEFKQTLTDKKFYDFIFTPGQDPFESLHRCLLNSEKDYHFGENDADIALTRNADTLPKIINFLKSKEDRWFWLIDQFEELFTNCGDETIRQNFIDSLARVIRAGNDSVRIVLAMRADFLEQLSFYPNLGALLDQNNIHLVTEMHPDELRQSIEQPAAQHGVIFESDLVEQIINDVQGQRGYLPLLQYTLNLLWETEVKTQGADGRAQINDHTLNIETYVTLEGVRGALQSRIDKLYQSFSLEQKAVTKQIFLKLVNIINTEGGSRPVSRRANLHEFEGKIVEETLDRFIQENLIITSTEYESQPGLMINDITERRRKLATVELAHEILLSSWSELKRWLEEEKENIILRNYLADETRRWQKILDTHGESKARSELLQGSRLEQLTALRDTRIFEKIGRINSDENHFIDVSLAWRNEQEKQKQKRRQYTLIALGVFSLVASALSIWGITNMRLANRNAAKADENALITQFQAREFRSWLTLSIDPEEKGSMLDWLLQKADGVPRFEKLLDNTYNLPVSEEYAETYKNDPVLSEVFQRVRKDCPDAKILKDCEEWKNKINKGIGEELRRLKSN